MRGSNRFHDVRSRMSRMVFSLKRPLLFVVICLLAFAPNSYALFGFGSSKPTEKKVAFLSPQRAEKFQKTVAFRTARSEELVILRHLVSEKQEELASLNKRLAKEFGIDGAKNYSYDAKTRSIALVETVEGEAAPKQTPHRVLEDDASGKAFLDLVVAKRLTMQQIETFQTVVSEKVLEYRRAEDVLRKEFGIDPAKKYRFDAEKSTIYEVVPPQDVQKKPTEGDAKAAK